MNRLQDAAIKKINAICEKYANDKSALMMILNDIQKEYGYIPKEVQEIVAAKTGVSVNEIYGVVTFYPFFSLAPKGKYVIGVCLGTACYVKGGQQILDRFSELLGIKPGRTTDDGLFTLDSLRCVGACGIAPAVTVNGKVYGMLTVDAVNKIIDEYKTKAENAPSVGDERPDRLFCPESGTDGDSHGGHAPHGAHDPVAPRDCNNVRSVAIQTEGLSAEPDLNAPINFEYSLAQGKAVVSDDPSVSDEDSCRVDAVKSYTEFINREACGKCTSCRIGTKRMLEILTKITDGKATMKDLDELETLAENIKDASLCGLGQTAPNTVLSTLKNFREEYLAHVVDKRCPAHVCKNLMQYEIQKEKCFGCGVCIKACPAHAISKTTYVAPGKRLPAYAVDPEKCIRCGRCIASCKFKAIVKK